VGINLNEIECFDMVTPRAERILNHWGQEGAMFKPGFHDTIRTVFSNNYHAKRSPFLVKNSDGIMSIKEEEGLNPQDINFLLLHNYYLGVHTYNYDQI
jgi:hypothetical protein